MSETQHRVFLLTACFALLHALRRGPPCWEWELAASCFLPWVMQWIIVLDVFFRFSFLLCLRAVTGQRVCVKEGWGH